MTPEEKTMMKTARKLRKLVYDDFMHKTANAVTALITAIRPMLAKLGPKVIASIKAIPPEKWAEIIPMVLSLIKTPTEASTSTVEKIASRLDGTVPDSKETAQALFLASLVLGKAYDRRPTVRVAKVIRLGEDVEGALRTIKEFG